MDKDKENTQKAAHAGVSEPEPKFTVENMRAHCLELFGVSSTTYAGATCGMEGEYTVREMKDHIAAWSKKEAH